MNPLRRALLAPLCLLLSATLAHAAPASPAAAPSFDGASATEWSRRLAASEMARRGDSLFRGSTGARWDYTAGLFALSLVQLGATTGDAATTAFGERIVGSFVNPDGSIDTYRLGDFNIDHVAPGRVLLHLWESTRQDRYRKAADLLRSQLRSHPRTTGGGFWHKQRYPSQMWLDGLYMGAPFYARYGVLFDEPAALDDVILQIALMDRHGFDAARGLHVHAWDEARTQSWADPATGASPHLWGRAVGWYAMALVDALDSIPASHHDIDTVTGILRRTADGIARYQDPATGTWWQILDLPGREGNYREATCTAMFVYALAKAINQGCLPRDRFAHVVRRGYEGLLREFVRRDADGSISLTRCCSVAGLGYTNSAGRARDGSFEYYVSEPIVDNDLKGVGPFILAGPEVDRLFAAGTPAADPVVTGWDALPAVLARIRPPTFPDRSFDITDHGAKHGTDAGDTIRAAIAACHAAGGGRVVIPPGTWDTGPIHLLSNVNLHVSTGATLRFSTDPDRYPLVMTRWEGVECRNYSPLIYAYDQENIAVTGGGTLDGQASNNNWWGWNNKAAGQPTRQKAGRDRLLAMGEKGVPVEDRILGDGAFLRPNFIQPYRCRNVLIEGVTILRSPMWEIHPVLSENVTVRGLTITTHGPNNDGCNPESSRFVLIEDTVFDTGDDCIAIKSGRNEDGRRLATPSEFIVIRKCTMKDGHGGVVIGSEISGGCRNVFIEDCTMDSPNLDRGLRFKSNARRGGSIENIFMRRVRIGQVAEAVLTIDFLYEEGARGDHPPSLRNVRLDQVESAASPRAFWIAGFPGATIDGITVTVCTFRGITSPEVISGASGLTLRRTAFLPATPARSINSVPPPPSP